MNIINKSILLFATSTALLMCSGARADFETCGQLSRVKMLTTHGDEAKDRVSTLTANGLKIFSLDYTRVSNAAAMQARVQSIFDAAGLTLPFVCVTSSSVPTGTSIVPTAIEVRTNPTGTQTVSVPSQSASAPNTVLSSYSACKGQWYLDFAKKSANTQNSDILYSAVMNTCAYKGSTDPNGVGAICLGVYGATLPLDPTPVIPPVATKCLGLFDPSEEAEHVCQGTDTALSGSPDACKSLSDSKDQAVCLGLTMANSAGASLASCNKLLPNTDAQAWCIGTVTLHTAETTDTDSNMFRSEAACDKLVSQP